MIPLAGDHQIHDPRKAAADQGVPMWWHLDANARVGNIVTNGLDSYQADEAVR